MKKLLQITLLSTALAFIGLWGCNDPDLKPEELNLDFSIIEGDTIRTVLRGKSEEMIPVDPSAIRQSIYGDTISTRASYLLHKPNRVFELGKLNKNAVGNTEPNIIAIGGSLTSGFRDGGYFNEGIETSYPNILATHLGIKNFIQPKFRKENYNGFGRKLESNQNLTGGPLKKFKMVNNNLGLIATQPDRVKLEIFGNVDKINNLALPNLTHSEFFTYQENLKDNIRNLVSPYFDRLFPKHTFQDSQFMNLVLSRKRDLVLIEFWSDNVLKYNLGWNLTGQRVASQSEISERAPYNPSTAINIPHQLKVLRTLEEKGIENAVLLNVPDYRHVPFFNYIKEEMVNEALGNSINIRFVDSQNNILSYSPSNHILLPTPTIDSLLGSKVNVSLKKGVYGNPPIPLMRNLVFKNVLEGYKRANKEIEEMGQRFNFPVVDIQKLYSNIHAGNYQSTNGEKITSEMFFSSDGLFPSPLGNAVIANEIIRTINQFYGAEIDLINTRPYLKL